MVQQEKNISRLFNIILKTINFIVSKRKIFVKGAQILNTLGEAKKIKLDYVIISSEPNDHFNQLKFLKKILKI